MTLDPQVTVELAAETSAIASERRFKYRAVKTPDLAWLYGIARPELASYLRRLSIEYRAVSRQEGGLQLLGNWPESLALQGFQRSLHFIVSRCFPLSCLLFAYFETQGVGFADDPG